MKPTQRQMDRFWESIDIQGSEDCWNWKKLKHPFGYGKFNYKQANKRIHINSHRMVWELTQGQIPEGLYVCHRCDNPSCCNPSHLFLGTQKDNMRDKMDKGRNQNQNGERNPSAKLSKDEVIKIRKMRLAGMKMRDIHGYFPQISLPTVKAIVYRQLWKHI